VALESTLAAHAEPSPSCTPPASPSLRGGDTPRGGTPAGTPASLRPPPSPLTLLAARLQLADLEEQSIMEPSPADTARVRPSTPPRETQAVARLGQMMGWDEDDGQEASNDGSGGGHAGSVRGDSDRVRRAAEMMHGDGTDAATRVQWEHTQRAIRQQEAEHAALQAQLKALRTAQSHGLVAMGRVVSTSSTAVSIAGGDSPVRNDFATEIADRESTHLAGSSVQPSKLSLTRVCVDPATRHEAGRGCLGVCALVRRCWSDSSRRIYMVGTCGRSR
jgi:hypothetical protein